ncbi:MAG: hypothetical protein HQK52_23680 [Oligoflexia bacterium]|nr:hypothetical protein [Oligoflexia bacterium]
MKIKRDAHAWFTLLIFLMVHVFTPYVGVAWAEEKSVSDLQKEVQEEYHHHDEGKGEDSFERARLTESDTEAMEMIGYLRLATPAAKFLFKIITSNVTATNPQCRISEYFNLVSLASVIAIGVRIAGMINDIVKTIELYDGMMAKLKEHKKNGTHISHEEFYKWMIDTNNIAKMVATYELAADSVDLTFSTADLAVAIYELSVILTAGFKTCVINPT